MLMPFKERSQTGRSNFSPFVRLSVGVTTGSVYELEQNAKIPNNKFLKKTNLHSAA